jgi:hypothetical protein
MLASGDATAVRPANVRSRTTNRPRKMVLAMLARQRGLCVALLQAAERKAIGDGAAPSSQSGSIRRRARWTRAGQGAVPSQGRGASLWINGPVSRSPFEKNLKKKL